MLCNSLFESGKQKVRNLKVVFNTFKYSFSNSSRCLNLCLVKGKVFNSITLIDCMAIQLIRELLEFISNSLPSVTNLFILQFLSTLSGGVSLKRLR